MFSHLNLSKKKKKTMKKKTTTTKTPFELGVIYLPFKTWGNRLGDPVVK